ncbi:putative 12-oxophytodienoate reductase 5 [Glarea lozoyensis 74030]|uniref:Putative 12-oxophytodienoate reductase 5 n=1 Tax=Glarea lozoyensis (strain ATCC 74030 / MF5533) TaxID=1104152 RepID=H0EQH1_GLAL7|nr:putative 12-oxophytodienoate reductase 5 [Glarea lozoyensis 74030]
MVEPRFDEVLDEQAKIDSLAVETKSDTKAQSLVPFQRILKKGGIKFIAAGGFKRDNAAPKVEAGDADGIILADGLPLNDYDRNTFYGADPPSKGYVDYPYFAAKTPA